MRMDLLMTYVIGIIQMFLGFFGWFILTNLGSHLAFFHVVMMWGLVGLGVFGVLEILAWTYIYVQNRT